jgi:hypothetical protein
VGVVCDIDLIAQQGDNYPCTRAEGGGEKGLGTYCMYVSTYPGYNPYTAHEACNHATEK